MNRTMDTASAAAEVTEGLVSIRVGAQAFGVPVLKVQDVIAQTPINRVPLAPTEIAGALNLRGRIVTAIDMRRRLRMPDRREDEGFVSIIVEQGGELYALVVDDVGDVLWLTAADRESAPITLPLHWSSICSGLYRLEAELLMVLNVEQVLSMTGGASQAA